VTEVIEVSPAELAADVLNRLSLPGIAAAGAIVGPSNDAQQQAGVVSCLAAGLPRIELYVPLQSMRCQMRCLAGTLEEADLIAQRVYRAMNGRGRIIGRMASTDQRYLIHIINILAGPSQHYDSPETWETLLFAELLIYTDPFDAQQS
jgi:hypothetical protein